MDDQKINQMLESIVELLELPDSAYETANARYHDLGEWMGRKESTCAPYKPHVFSQGSFRLGTAIRPLDEKEKYDLDLACELKEGVVRETHTQQSLKKLVGQEVESYRRTKGIKEPLEEKHRCWRLEYADTLSFHMDIVPCIPAELRQRQRINEALMKAGESKVFANSTSDLTVVITDDRHPGFLRICDDWKISNPEGYAHWFESKMRLAASILQERVRKFNAASVDKIPVFKWKTPLQRCVQLLKRHRDQMYKSDPDAKPISVIITTLSARAYEGESDIAIAMRNILSKMGNLVRTNTPRVPNPVDPSEDFADKWTTEDGRRLKLEENFWTWLEQAKAFFDRVNISEDAALIAEQATRGLAIPIDAGDLRKKFGLSTGTVTPKVSVIRKAEPAKPWRATF